MYIYIIYYYIYTIYSCICNILNKFNHNKTLTVKREGMELVLKAEILCRKGLHVCVCGGTVSTAGCLLWVGGAANPVAYLGCHGLGSQ